MNVGCPLWIQIHTNFCFYCLVLCITVIKCPVLYDKYHQVVYLVDAMVRKRQHREWLEVVVFNGYIHSHSELCQKYNVAKYNCCIPNIFICLKAIKQLYVCVFGFIFLFLSFTTPWIWNIWCTLNADQFLPCDFSSYHALIEQRYTHPMYSVTISPVWAMLNKTKEHVIDISRISRRIFHPCKFP